MKRNWIVIVALLVVMRTVAVAEERYVDYLYMEPNEGGSSAGHVAVGFEERTYAFQRSPEGRLVLERDSSGTRASTCAGSTRSSVIVPCTGRAWPSRTTRSNASAQGSTAATSSSSVSSR